MCRFENCRINRKTLTGGHTDTLQLVTDRRTDGQTHDHSIYRASLVSRGKIWTSGIYPRRFGSLPKRRGMVARYMLVPCVYL